MLHETVHFPPHITALVKELQIHADTRGVLEKHAHYVPQDESLYHVYITLGYSPETGKFTTNPSYQEAIALIRNEYRDLLAKELSELKVFTSDASTDWDGDKGMKEEFLKTYYDNGLNEFANPYEVGLEDLQFNCQEEIVMQDTKPAEYWTGASPKETKKTFSFLSPSPSKKVNVHTPRSDKGLKNLSVRVQNIVSQRQNTSYKQVADDLIVELELEERNDSLKEEKNIRRRVYDALNVLVAANVVGKSGKTVFWNSNPSNATQLNSSVQKTDYIRVTEEIEKRTDEKKQILKDLFNKTLAFQALIRKNKNISKAADAISFPFIIVATPDTPSNCVTAR